MQFVDFSQRFMHPGQSSFQNPRNRHLNYRNRNNQYSEEQYNYPLLSNHQHVPSHNKPHRSRHSEHEYRTNNSNHPHLQRDNPNLLRFKWKPFQSIFDGPSEPQNQVTQHFKPSYRYPSQQETLVSYSQLLMPSPYNNSICEQ